MGPRGRGWDSYSPNFSVLLLLAVLESVPWNPALNLCPKSQLTCQRLWVAGGVLLLVTTGCRTFHPLAERTKSQIVSARSWANGGLEAMQSGHLQRAEGFFTRAAEQHPTDFRNRANLARTYFRSGEIAKAVQEMEAAVALSDNDPWMTVELGQMYLAKGDLDKARQQAERAMAEVHRFVPGYTLLGQVSVRAGDYDQALAYLHKAASLDPSDLSIPIELAKAYRGNKEPRKALAAIDHLLSRHPIDSQPEQAILTKADILIELEQQSTAIATLRQVMQGQHPTVAVANKLVNLQVEAGKLSQARETIVRAQAEFPDVEEVQLLARQLSDLAHEGTILR